MGKFFKFNKKVKKSVKKTRAKKPAMVKMVKAEVKKQTAKIDEVKHQNLSVTGTNLQAYNTILGTLTTIDVTAPLYAISQGVADGQRIGNRIRIKSYIVRASLNISTTSNINNMYIRVMILRKKVGIDTPNGNYGRLYQFGATSVAPTGTTLDLMRYINKDFYTVYHSKIFLLGSNDSVQSVIPGNNTAICRMLTMNMTKHVTNVIYDDTTIFPQNVGFYMVFVPCLANGFAVSSGQMAPFYVNVDSEVLYTDS